MIDGDIYKGGPKGTHKSDNMIADTAFGGYETTKARYADRLLMADAPLLLEEVKRYRLMDCAITQAEHMRAQVGDNTWHYAMEVWLYPLTHYWEVEDELALIESFISTNRDAWVKHWGEPSEVVRKRGD